MHPEHIKAAIALLEPHGSRFRSLIDRLQGDPAAFTKADAVELNQAYEELYQVAWAQGLQSVCRQITTLSVRLVDQYKIVPADTQAARLKKELETTPPDTEETP